jgi:hypothetical protein
MFRISEYLIFKTYFTIILIFFKWLSNCTYLRVAMWFLRVIGVSSPQMFRITLDPNIPNLPL